MGDQLAKAIGEPLQKIYHDTCVYCCDDCKCSSDCLSCCRISIETHPHEKDIEINEHD